MVSDELAPLEAHVESQVKHLTAVSRVLRELVRVEGKYAEEYAELPFDVPADAKSTLKRFPQLERVSGSFSDFVHKCSMLKAAVAEDLTKEIIVPLEAFTADHVEKAQHLLSELYELLQKEKAFDLAYENLREGCKNETAAASESASSAQDGSTLQLHRVHRDQLLRKRDAERLTIQQWITALHFAGQRYEAHVRDVLRRTLVVYERMIASLAALISELQEQLSEDTSATSTVAAQVSANNNSSGVSEESWESFMAGYDCHVATTCWMSDLFKQLIPVEHKAAKCLQTAVKLDCALSKAFGGVEFSSRLSGLIRFHGLLTVNIANPIMRTLKFSRERQERMRNELSKSLKETRTLVVGARTRLNASVTEKDKTPVRCDSLTSSETSECSLEDNNEGDENSRNGASDEEVLIENTPELIQLGTLERKLALQRQEMVRVLEQTSFLGVKTMELMVQDFLKHVTKALAALSDTSSIRAEPQDIQRNKPETSPQPWELITERLSIIVSNQPALLVEECQDIQHRQISSSKNNAMVRRRRATCKAARGMSEPSAVQVASSFVQSAVGITYWAAEVGSRTAKAHVPHSFEECVVLAVLLAMIVSMIRICIRSSHLEISWSDLTHSHHSNSEDLVQIVKLSIEVCTQQVGTTTSST